MIPFFLSLCKIISFELNIKKNLNAIFKSPTVYDHLYIFIIKLHLYLYYKITSRWDNKTRKHIISFLNQTKIGLNFRYC